MSAHTIARRRFLQALGGATFLWPLAGRLFADERNPLKRLVIFMQNNGTQQANFWPTDDSFTSPILEPLLGDGTTSIARKTNVVRGVYVPNAAPPGTGANQHDMGFARFFTGEPLINIGGHPWAGGPSVDQILATAWGIDSLTTAILSSSVEPHPKPGFDHRRSFCYQAPGVHKLPVLDPFPVYNEYFPDTSAQEGTRQRLLARRSVLDAVSGNLASASARLGPNERNKLDLHLTSIRRVEESLRRVLENQPVTCPRPLGPRDFTHTAPALLLNDESAIPEIVGNMIDLAAVALNCGIVRIATIQFGYGGGKWRFAWEGINRNCHDDVAHRDTSDAGSSPENTDYVVRMNHYYCSQVARMAQALEAAPEGGGTVLDNSLVVWANEFGRGDHNQRNIPVVLIGKAGGAVPRGGQFINVGDQVFNRVGCTILNAMGQPTPGFGDVTDCGTLQGVM